MSLPLNFSGVYGASPNSLAAAAPVEEWRFLRVLSASHRYPAFKGITVSQSSLEFLFFFDSSMSLGCRGKSACDRSLGPPARVVPLFSDLLLHQ